MKKILELQKLHRGHCPKKEKNKKIFPFYLFLPSKKARACVLRLNTREYESEGENTSCGFSKRFLESRRCHKKRDRKKRDEKKQTDKKNENNRQTDGGSRRHIKRKGKKGRFQLPQQKPQQQPI